jgi:2'-5' RNA ligase
MSRLFVAIDLPIAVTSVLQRLQQRVEPPPAAGLRLISAEQMHLTLHFIGQADIAGVLDALQAVRARAFTLRLAGVGQFYSRSGTSLWAGVERDPPLLALHAAVGLALSGIGQLIEPRAYTPHITLARCKLELPAQTITTFLDNPTALTLPEVAVRDFALFSSITANAGPQYHCEQRFPLS